MIPFPTDDMAPKATGRFVAAYSRVLALYLAGVALLWILGIESIYGHPTPFYALLKPVFTTWSAPCAVLFLMTLAVAVFRRTAFQEQDRAHLLVPAVLLALCVPGLWYDKVAFAGFTTQTVRHLPVILVVVGGGAGLLAGLRRMAWFEREPSPRAVLWTLVGLAAFLFLFAAAVAMLRGGADGISQAFARQRYEPIGDIGLGGSIRGMFHDFLKLYPHLSLHMKSHPPGPIALMWFLSYIVGREPLGLSLAVMALASLNVVPLYLWVREFAERRMALTACLLYAVMPTVVLFTATSMDIAFLFFVLWTLFLFERALARRSIAFSLAAGAAYGVLSVLHFSLLALGAYFAFSGLRRILFPAGPRAKELLTVTQTAVCMTLTLVAFHLLLYAWSGFSIIACFMHEFQYTMAYVSPHLFNVVPEQNPGYVEDQTAPRFPASVWKVLNPVCWFYYVGIPVSLLAYWRLRRPRPETKGLYLVFLLTMAALSLLYVAKGEGERSALYVFPFAAIIASDFLHQATLKLRTPALLLATLAFLAWQAWLTESLLYTYW